MLAERTGLEPATPGVTGRYSNQLNYRSFSKLPKHFTKFFIVSDLSPSVDFVFTTFSNKE